jgi:drug/metabolite transporter (DMT)-like permease
MTAPTSTGLKWAIIATVISGFSVFLNALVVKGIDPLVHTTVKNSVAGICIILTLLFTARRSLPTLNKKTLFQLLAISLIGGSLPFYLYFVGLKEIGATQGALIQKTMVLWVALLAWPILKEKISGKLLLGIGLLYGSSLVYGVNSLTSINRGHILVLGATLLWAVENIIAKKVLAKVSPNLVVSSRMVIGSFILIGMLFTTHKASLVGQLSSTQWLMLSGLGVVLFTYVSSWYRALKFLPATVVSSILVGATIITSLLEASLTNHAYTFASLGQAILILIGVGLVVTSISRLWPQRTQTLSRI